MAIENAIDKYI